MSGIEILVREHQNILKVVKAIRQSAIQAMNDGAVDTKNFWEYLDFIRNYADKHHHGKEEKILFKIMTETLGAAAEKLIKHGMLVEHDMGRLYAQNLETALRSYENQPNDDARVDIIANAVAYGELLQRHIDKEDNVVYPFAERQFSKEILEKVNQDTEVFEKEEAAVREHYENWVNQL